ncbi:MAG: hypothetical protein PW792_00180 [Acidobacteriaceae bacterium]|nr:hypothetical protein [Acidobacteriaceae bacterium]
MLGLCVWTIARQPLGAEDYRFARCGREMWEQPSAISGYFTTCGNLNGDGFLGYRLAALPLSLERAVLLTADHFRKPENKLYPGKTLNGTIWEARHQLSGVKWLLRLPFVFFALWAGGGVWWVCRRLFGNEGGALALALYVFCPSVIQYATRPSNEILALWGLYGLIYTAIGVAHALQGPRSKWRPRILLLTVALGLTASAHTLAGLIGWVLGAGFFFYVAERRRSYVAPIMFYSAFGSLVVLFAVFGFRLSAFQYLFTGGSARFSIGTIAAKHFLLQPENAGISIALLVSVLLYVTTKRSRYFGNTAPLLCAVVLMLIYTTQVTTAPWLWAVPFLVSFIGGVFADALESRYRKTYVLLGSATVLTQAALCIITLGGWLH